MKTHIIFLTIFNLIFSLSSVAKTNYDKGEKFPGVDTIVTSSEKSNSPDFFDSTDYSIQMRDSDGTIMNLGKWRGENLLIIYVHSDCPYCKKLVKKYGAELQDTVLRVMVLFSGSDTTEIKEFREETSSKYPYYIDYAFQFRRKYGTPVVPVTFYINSNGTAERIAGLKENEVEALIKKINEG